MGDAPKYNGMKFIIIYNCIILITPTQNNILANLKMYFLIQIFVFERRKRLNIDIFNINIKGFMKAVKCRLPIGKFNIPINKLIKSNPINRISNFDNLSLVKLNTINSISNRNLILNIVNIKGVLTPKKTAKPPTVKSMAP